IGGAATTLTIGGTSGTATIRNGTIAFTNATTIDALAATANINILSVGGGYGSTGVTASNAGNIQANGTLTVDGTSLLTGDVTATGDLAVNGGDLTTTQGTFNLLATPTTLNIGAAATTVSLGNASGTTTVNGNLSVGTGRTLTTTGQVSFTPA